MSGERIDPEKLQRQLQDQLGRKPAQKRDLDWFVTLDDAAAAKVAETRACGPCSACCELLPVSVLGKAAGVRCPHQCFVAHPGGCCTMYGGRPDACRTFACLWRSGELSDARGSDRRRPDVLGLMFTPTRKLYALDNHQILIAYETAPGAARRNPGAYMLARYARTRVILVQQLPVDDAANHDALRIAMGPPAAVEKVQRLVVSTVRSLDELL